MIKIRVCVHGVEGCHDFMNNMCLHDYIVIYVIKFC